MEIFCENGNLIKNLVATLKNLNSQATFIFSSEKISCQMMDRAHIAISVVEIQKDYFKSYNCPFTFTACLDLESTEKILKILTTNFFIKAESRTADALEFADEKVSFKLNLYDIDEEMYEIPEDLDQHKIVSIEQTFEQYFEFLTSLKTSGASSLDIVDFDLDENNIIFQATGVSIKCDIKLPFQLATNIADLEKIKNLAFSIKYLSFFKCANPGNVRMIIGKEQPLIIKFEFKETPFVNLMFCLAPKCDD